MKLTLREALAESHVAAVVIAALFLFGIDEAFQAIIPLVLHVIEFVITAIAILDIPSHETVWELVQFTVWVIKLLYAMTMFAFAWLISIKVYGKGPLVLLGSYRTRVIARLHD